MAIKGATKAAPAVNTDSAENDGPSSDMFLADLHKRVDSNSSVEARLSKGFSEIGNENAFEEAGTCCAPAE